MKKIRRKPRKVILHFIVSATTNGGYEKAEKSTKGLGGFLFGIQIKRCEDRK